MTGSPENARLSRLAAATGRSKSYYLRELVTAGIEVTAAALAAVVFLLAVAQIMWFHHRYQSYNVFAQPAQSTASDRDFTNETFLELREQIPKYFPGVFRRAGTFTPLWFGSLGRREIWAVYYPSNAGCPSSASSAYLLLGQDRFAYYALEGSC